MENTQLVIKQMLSLAALILQCLCSRIYGQEDEVLGWSFYGDPLHMFLKTMIDQVLYLGEFALYSL